MPFWRRQFHRSEHGAVSVLLFSCVWAKPLAARPNRKVRPWKPSPFIASLAMYVPTTWVRVENIPLPFSTYTHLSSPLFSKHAYHLSQKTPTMLPSSLLCVHAEWFASALYRTIWAVRNGRQPRGGMSIIGGDQRISTASWRWFSSLRCEQPERTRQFFRQLPHDVGA